MDRITLDVPYDAGEVYRNSKLKTYPDGTKNLIASNAPVFRDKTYSTEIEYFRPEDEPKKKKKKSKHKSKDAEPRADSLKRAKDAVFDLMLCNDFEYFFTGTINPDWLDSKNPKELLQPVQQWLKDMVKRYDLHYIMIAEYHKKGGVHFHGCFKSERELRMEDSGTKIYYGYKKPVRNDRAEFLGLTGGKTVYNLKSWSFGWSTAIKLTGDRLRIARYVTKYITKDVKKIFGKFYWHSQNLKKPVITVQDIKYNDLETVEYNGFKYLFVRGDDTEQCEELNMLFF